MKIVAIKSSGSEAEICAISRYTTLQHIEKFAKNSGLGSVSELS